MEKIEYLKVLVEAAKVTSHDYFIEGSIRRTCKSIEDDLGIKKEQNQGSGQTDSHE